MMARRTETELAALGGRPRRRVRAWLFLAIGLVAGACNLNPRPGTPDDNDDGKSNAGTGGSGGSGLNPRPGEGAGGSTSSPSPTDQDAGAPPATESDAGHTTGSSDAGEVEASVEAATN